MPARSWSRAIMSAGSTASASCPMRRPLLRARDADWAGAARGLAFQLGEALGSLPAGDVAAQRAALDLNGRKALARLGVRLGTESVYIEAVLKPQAAGLRALLWAVWNDASTPVVPASVAQPRDPAG